VKIAFWSASFFEGVGGAEHVVASLLNAYTARGEKCWLVANKRKAYQRVSTSARLDRRVGIFLGSFRNPLLDRNNPFVFLYRLCRYFLSCCRLFGWLIWNRMDVIHQHFIGLDIVVLVVFKRLLGFQLIVTFHGLELELARESGLSDWKNRFAIRHADHATAVSDHLARQLNERYAADSVTFIPNAVRIDEARPPVPAGPMSDITPGFFLFCGRLDPVKQVPGLVEAFASAIDAGCTKQLCIIGDGPDRGELEATIRRLNIRDRVQVLGEMQHQQALGLMGQCFCLLLNSESEGSPLVILEAMTLGKPVIAPHVGGISDLVTHEYNGLLFPCNDQRQLCEAIVTMSQNESIAANYGQNAERIMSAQMSLDTVAKKYLELYRAKNKKVTG
jgi:glycosyltransferase involved in cell wall biosynthesis